MDANLTTGPHIHSSTSPSCYVGNECGVPTKSHIAIRPDTDSSTTTGYIVSSNNWITNESIASTDSHFAIELCIDTSTIICSIINKLGASTDV